MGYNEGMKTLTKKELRRIRRSRYESDSTVFGWMYRLMLEIERHPCRPCADLVKDESGAFKTCEALLNIRAVNGNEHEDSDGDDRRWVGMYLNVDERKAVDDLCKRMDLTRSQLLRQSIRAYQLHASGLARLPKKKV